MALRNRVPRHFGDGHLSVKNVTNVPVPKVTHRAVAAPASKISQNTPLRAGGGLGNILLAAFVGVAELADALA